MQLTKNQQAIINLLLQSRDYVSADQVSKKLGFSTKTILRNVKSINAQSNEKNLIISERGKGLKLDYSSYILDRNNQDTIYQKTLLSSVGIMFCWKYYSDHLILLIWIKLMTNITLANRLLKQILRQ
nr:helix-turn-helix domain-containing protein [Oenococcus oeni]